MIHDLLSVFHAAATDKLVDELAKGKLMEKVLRSMQPLEKRDKNLGKEGFYN